MKKYTFLHNPALINAFDERAYSINESYLHRQVTFDELPILEMLQIDFDLCKTNPEEKRYNPESETIRRETSWSEYLIDTRWNEENIRECAEFLTKHLDYLPEYIITAIYTIMSECLGYKSYHFSISSASDEHQQKEYIELGKTHLAFLMKLIEELGRLGVDVRAINISTKPYYLGARVARCFEEVCNLPSELKKVITNNDDTEARRNMFYNTICVNTIDEFLQMLINNINILNIPNDQMVDPVHMDFSKYYYPNEAIKNTLNLPVGEKRNTLEVIKSFKEALSKGRFIEAYYERKKPIQKNDTEEISTHVTRPVDYDILKAFISFLLKNNFIYYDELSLQVVANDAVSQNKEHIIHLFYQMIKDVMACRDLNNGTDSAVQSNLSQINLLLSDKETALKELQAILEVILARTSTEAKSKYMNGTVIEVDAVEVRDEEDQKKKTETNSLESLVNEMLKKIEDLEKRQERVEETVIEMNKRIKKLNDDIEMYITRGGNKPDIGKEDVRKAIVCAKCCQAKTASSKIRKIILLSSLLLSLMAVHQKAEMPHVDQPIESNEIVENRQDISTNPYTENKKTEKYVEMHLFEMTEGVNDYYESAYDKTPYGKTEQTGIIIRYYAFKDNSLVKSFGQDEELQAFITNNNPQEYMWKAAISCLDYQIVSSFIENGLEIPIEYTTFFTDYTPSVGLKRERTDN